MLNLAKNLKNSFTALALLPLLMLLVITSMGANQPHANVLR